MKNVCYLGQEMLILNTMNPAETFILNQNEPHQSIILYLQSVVKQTIPEVELKFKYRVPFYYVNGKPYCYFNVSEKKNYVDLGIWYGAHLTKNKEHLVVENRTVIRSLRYATLEEIEHSVLVEVLQEAYAMRNKRFYK